MGSEMCIRDRSFTFSGNIVDEGSRVVENGISLITVNDASHSGGSIESVESVKKYATRIYASRERAVTAADYEALIPTIYPQTESVSAYGGDEYVVEGVIVLVDPLTALVEALVDVVAPDVVRDVTTLPRTKLPFE